MNMSENFIQTSKDNALSLVIRPNKHAANQTVSKHKSKNTKNYLDIKYLLMK